MNRALSLAMATIEKLTIQLDVYIRAILSHLERARIVALRERAGRRHRAFDNVYAPAPAAAGTK